MAKVANPVRTVKKVVILGGGPAGRGVLESLYNYAKTKKNSLKLEVIIVDKKDYAENPPANIRALVVPDFNKYAVVSYQELYHNYESPFLSVQIIVAEVIKVSPNNVQIRRPNERGAYEADGAAIEEITFDALVAATGTRYPLFKGTALHFDQRKEEITNFIQRIKNANHILIVGGGIVGVELVGEILDVSPQKQITIVQSGDRLVPSNSVGASSITLKRLRTFPNVKIHFGQRVDAQEVLEHGYSGAQHEYRTTKGEVVNADLAFLTAGNEAPNTEMFQHDLASVLAPNGYIKVRPTLQVEGHDNIFAVGDCAALTVGKLAANLPAQITTVAQNVVAILNASKLPSKYGNKGYEAPGLIPLGARFGILAILSFFGKPVSGAWVSSLKTKFLVEKSGLKPVEW